LLTLQGELEHRRAKNQYRRTNQINVVQQMNALDRREHHLRTRVDAIDELCTKGDGASKSGADELEEHWGESSGRYHISKAGTGVPLGTFRQDDPAYKVL
jgi:hypothetical protein